MSAALPPLNPCDAGGASTLALKWAALTQAAEAVAALAGVAASDDRPTNFEALLRGADPWRARRAADGVFDLAAIMEPGLAALLEVSARGADARPAALSLHDEFEAARSALLSVLTPGDCA